MSLGHLHLSGTIYAVPKAFTCCHDLSDRNYSTCEVQVLLVRSEFAQIGEAVGRFSVQILVQLLGTVREEEPCHLLSVPLQRQIV